MWNVFDCLDCGIILLHSENFQLKLSQSQPEKRYTFVKLVVKAPPRLACVESVCIYVCMCVSKIQKCKIIYEWRT